MQLNATGPSRSGKWSHLTLGSYTREITNTTIPDVASWKAVLLHTSVLAGILLLIQVPSAQLNAATDSKTTPLIPGSTLARLSPPASSAMPSSPQLSAA